MDDPDYLNPTLRKLDRYIRNGILPGSNLILTYETEKKPLNIRIAEILMEKYLRD